MTSQPSQTSRTHWVCAVNAKGGVAKTTTAINIAGALNQFDQDVLLIDADPQGGATEALGLAEHYDAEPPTIFDAIANPSTAADVVPDLVLEHDEMDVVPSNVDLLNLERELTIADLMARMDVDGADPSLLEPYTVATHADDVTGRGHAHHLLRAALEPAASGYDIVIVDAPPFYGEIFSACLYAAPDMLVPMLAEGSGQKALELLVDEAASLEATVQETEQRSLGTRELIALAQRVPNPPTNEAKRMLDWLDVVFDDVPVHRVPDRVDVQYAADHGVSVFEYGPADPVIRDVYLDAARDVLDALEQDEVAA